MAERHGFARCAVCGQVLHGIPRMDNVRRYPKSARRVSRKFGGYLCSKCAREVIKKEARNLWE